MKKIVSDTRVLDYCDNAKEFLEKFPDVEVTLIEYGFDIDADRQRFHDYQLVVEKKDATPAMVEWAKDRDLLGNDGYGLDDDADDNAAAIEIPLQAEGYGSLWIDNAK